jgi:C-terminal processing protease CtpA/Prc
MRYYIIAIICALSLGSLAVVSAQQQPKNVEIFDAAWRFTNDYYYDEGFNGFDWDGVRKEYRKKAQRSKDSRELYWDVLSPMLRLLETSHVTAVQPSQTSKRNERSQAKLERMEPSIDRCTGLAMAYGKPAINSRIIAIDKNSALFRQGVRVGWRLITPPPAKNGVVSLDFLTLAGGRKTLTVSLTDLDSGRRSATDLGATQDFGNDLFAVIRAARASSTDTEKKVIYEPLGIAFTSGRFDNAPYVVTVRPGSEALKANIPIGASLVRIRASGAVKDLLAVDLTVKTPSDEVVNAAFKAPCKRDESAEAAPVASMYDSQTLVLKFDRFTPSSAEWVKQTISKIKPSRVVLDLRDNGGGAVTAMQEINGIFLGKDVFIARAKGRSKIARDTGKPETESILTTGDGPVFKGKVSVLIGPLSASAAEVTAATLRHYRRASLVGMLTAGEVIVSNGFRLPDGGTLQIATRDFVGAGYEPIEGRGVNPDLTIWNDLVSIRAGRDTVLEAAVSRMEDGVTVRQ